MTVEEALAASVVEPVNDIFEIDPETRVITVPASEKLFGVANDGNSERKHFRCPKIVGDNIDLSTMHLYINYQNANGQKYPYLVEDIRTDGDYITFSWLIGPDVVAYKGQIKFIVCAKKGDGTIPEWNTTIAEGTVLEGLEATDEVVERNPDIIEQILTRLDNVTEIPQEKVTEAVSTYMEANPINVPKNLSDLKEDSEHRIVTDAEKQSWNNKSNFSGNYEDLRGSYDVAEDRNYREFAVYTMYNANEAQTTSGYVRVELTDVNGANVTVQSMAGVPKSGYYRCVFHIVLGNIINLFDVKASSNTSLTTVSMYGETETVLSNVKKIGIISYANIGVGSKIKIMAR